MSAVNTFLVDNVAYARSADGCMIAYENVGEGDPLVLLHGVTETRDSWREAGYVDRFLRLNRRLILIDCRGHGSSDKPHDPSAYVGNKRTADVIAVLDHAGIRRAAIMGYSMGGVIALAAAASHPDRFTALIVNGAHPYAEDMAPFRAALHNGFDPWIGVLEQMAPQLSTETRRRICRGDIAAVQASLVRDRKDFSAAFAGFSLPVLAIAGTLDPRHDAIRRFAELVHGEFLPLAGQNHVTAFLDTDAVAPAVGQFLARIASNDPDQGD